MKKLCAMGILAVLVSGVWAEEGKTIRAGQGSVIVVEKLPVTLVVKGDTLVLGDIGVRDAASQPHTWSLRKGDRALHGLAMPDREFNWFSIDDQDSLSKRIKVRVEARDENEWPHGLSKDKHLRLRLQADDAEDEDTMVIINEEEPDSAAGEAEAEKVIVLKKVREKKGEKEQRHISIAVDGKDLYPLAGMGLILREDESKLLVDEVLKEVAPKDQPFKVDDQIISLEGKNVSSAKEFIKQYEAIETGKTVKVRVMRQSSTKELSFAKPEDSAKVTIIKRKKR